jgi:hypothetical protein
LTGEMEKLAPEAAARSSPPSGIAWIFAGSLICLVLLSLLLIQHAVYEKQIDTDGTDVLHRQIGRLMDQSVSERSSGTSLRTRAPARAPKVAPGIDHPSAPVPIASGDMVPMTEFEVSAAPPKAIITPPAIPSSQYADEQIHLADQLALAGKLKESAAALLSAVDSHPQDVQLRVAAIRAQMRIRDYAGAKTLAQVGLQQDCSQNDYVMFEQLLKTIPSR